MRNLTPAKVTVLMFLVIGLLIVAYVGKRLIATEEPPPPQVATRNVPMAVADLEPGTVITEAHLGQGPIRVDQLESDMLLSNRVILGRVVKERIPAATAIRSSALYRPGERPELGLREGYRAITLAVGESVDMVDGLIMPGDYVDLHMTPSGLDQDPRLGRGLTLTVIKAVRVIAINRNFQPAVVERGLNSVTLELTPRQANILVLAQQRGTITMSYNPNGEQIAEQRVVGGEGDPDRVTMNEILNLPEEPKEDPPYILEQYRGGGRSMVRFREGRRLPWDDDAGDDDAYFDPWDVRNDRRPNTPNVPGVSPTTPNIDSAPRPGNRNLPPMPSAMQPSDRSAGRRL